MVPAFNPASCPNLAVPAEVMQHVVQIESSANPLAIGVVGGRLQRQPRTLGEAVATARMLESKGYDYSVGIAQVNRSNLSRYGLNTFERAFDGCANLTAGARILAECYGRSDGDWGKAFSCYYSGNFITGFRDGYVQRVYDTMDASIPRGSEPIAVHPQARKPLRGIGTALRDRLAQPGTAAYRISIRSVALDSVAMAAVPATARETTPAMEKKPASPRRPRTEAPGSGIPGYGANTAFVPRVSGPNGAPAAGQAAPWSMVPGPSSTSASTSSSAPAQDVSDDAFVF
jgi:type IV secretion system protein VirB1